jgi:hypothetical protein
MVASSFSRNRIAFRSCDTCGDDAAQRYKRNKDVYAAADHDGTPCERDDQRRSGNAEPSIAQTQMQRREKPVAASLRSERRSPGKEAAHRV